MWRGLGFEGPSWPGRDLPKISCSGPQNEPLGQAAGEEKHTCVVQYILFPPHSTSTKDR